MTAERRRRVVLSGGPGSGKTALVEHYQKAGHATVPEAALQIIQELTRSMGLRPGLSTGHRSGHAHRAAGRLD